MDTNTVKTLDDVEAEMGELGPDWRTGYRLLLQNEAVFSETCAAINIPSTLKSSLRGARCGTSLKEVTKQRIQQLAAFIRSK